MSKVIACDIAIIGGGSGGLSLAAGASQLGVEVVLIESGKMGGDCLNYGCVPSKALLSAAKACYQVKAAQYFGVHAKTLAVDFSKVMQHIQKVIDTIAVHDSVDRFESLGVCVIQAPGQFIDAKTVAAGDSIVKAKRFVVATGSSPFVPPIHGIEKVPYLTNETVFKLKQLPEKLVVIGGGPIGCELAQAFAMLGSDVTILEAFKMLPNDDVDCVQIVREKLQKLDIAIHESISVLGMVKNDDGSIIVNIEKNGEKLEIKASELLVSTGRRANVDGLALANANVDFSSKGIQVDARMRSSNKKIYAIGDVAGSYQFTHVANYHAGIVLRNILFRLPAKVDYRAIPWVTYTYPEIAHVGMLAADAAKIAGTKIIESTFAENDRAQTENQTLGKIKLISDSRGRILGVTIVGAQAGELILPWVIAIRENKSLRSFTDTIVPYPTLSEISKRVAGEYYKPKLFSNKVRCLVRWLLKLG